MTQASSIADHLPVNLDTVDIDPRALRVVRRLVRAVDDVQALGAPFDAALNPLLDALVTTARAADSMRDASPGQATPQKRRVAA